MNKAVWIDELGGVYSADRKRLLKVPDVKRYQIVEGCEQTDEHAFDDCKELESLYVPESFGDQAAEEMFNNMPISVGNFCHWDRPYVDEVYDVNDYWCDELKLQKQLEYFRAHPEVGVVTCAGCKLLVRSNKLVPNAVEPIHPAVDGNVKRFYFSKNYAGGLYAMPLTLLIKRDVLQYVDFDEFVKRGFPVEDLPMQAVMAQHAKWGHINDLCVVYRVYKESATFISVEHPKYMLYHKGLAEIRRYLNELFPDDICFTEDELQEQVFYKEFLLYLHRREYKKAKQLIADSRVLDHMPKVKQAIRFTKTWLHFMGAYYIKEQSYKKDINQRT